MEVLNDLLNYKNLKIYQNTEMFCFSLDSVLLANFVTINKKDKEILDIGTGNAPIPLILSTKTSAHITAVEIQREAYELANKSISYNNLNNQITILNDDINEYVKTKETESFDTIVCNPPFFKVTDKVKISDSMYKQIARHEIKLTLKQIVQISKKLLKNNGSLNIVHRPDRLIEIIYLMKENNIEPKRIQFVYPKENSEANMILISGVKMGKPGLKIEHPIFAHNADGSYSKEIVKMFS